MRLKKSFYKNIFLVGFTSLLNDLSSEMILPILPLLITHLGGSGIAIGLIGGLRDSGAEILKLYCGYISDRMGKRTAFIYAGYITSAFFKFMLAFASSWIQILTLIGFERVGKALRTAPRDALITQSTPDSLGKSFGIHKAMDTCGAIFGSIASFFLVWYYQASFSTIIVIAGCIGILSILPLFSISEPTIEPQKNRLNFDVSQFSLSFITFTIISGIFSFAHVSYMFFILHAQTMLNQSSPIFRSMLLYVLFNTAYTLCAIPCGILSDNIGRWNMIFAGYALYSITMLLFLHATTTPCFVIAFIVYGIALAFIHVNHKALAADLAPAHLKATALGLFETVTGIIILIAGLLAGCIWQYWGHSYVFMYAQAISLITCLLLIIFKKSLQKTINPAEEARYPLGG